ncbi:hypothetical protein SLE2022_260470 [Rubroshorea leprosula]
MKPDLMIKETKHEGIRMAPFNCKTKIKWGHLASQAPSRIQHNHQYSNKRRYWQTAKETCAISHLPVPSIF